MQLKIKSVLSKKLYLTTIPQNKRADFKSPNRSNHSRMSFNTPLKNLSQQRYKKKLTKLKDSASQNTQNNNKQILQNLNSLQEQYTYMKNNLNRSNSLKQSLKIKGVPLSSINLNQRQSIGSKKTYNYLTTSVCTFNSTIKSRNNSFSNSNYMKVVSIGSQCNKKQKNTAKSTIIDLLQKKEFIYHYFKIDIRQLNCIDYYQLIVIYLFLFSFKKDFINFYCQTYNDNDLYVLCCIVIIIIQFYYSKMNPVTNSVRQPYLPDQQLSSNLSNKSKQGYINLSPSRQLKSKLSANKAINKYNQSHDSHPYEDTLNKVYIVQNQQNADLPIRTEQKFRAIPKYSLDQAVIKLAFGQKQQSVSSNRNKKKLSVTKLFQNVDLGNKKDNNYINISMNSSSDFKYK